ncbi:MAG TPA: hypothetical protein VGE34_04545 [Candidatus Saccharimonadales bacterium]
MSEIPRVHPVVEDQVQTEGEDIGRFKDTDVTRDIASSMNYSLDRGMSWDVIDRSATEATVEGLADAALENPAQVEHDYHVLQDEAKRIAAEAHK